MLEYAARDADTVVWLFYILKERLIQENLIKQLTINCNKMCYKKIEKITFKKIEI